MSMSEFRQFICRACGLVYDEALGDVDSGLVPGTRFEDIPEDWSCPLCGVTKADFEPLDIKAQAGYAAGADQPRTARIPRLSRSQGRAWPSGGARVDDGATRAGVVIVGAGTAGWALIEQLRARSTALPITLVSTCSADRYDKPRLSVALHQGLDPSALPRESGEQAAARLGVRLLAQTAVSGISMASRTVRTARGAIRFDDLVLAHGARARSCDGLPDALTWRINDLASYRGLRAALEPAATEAFRAKRPEKPSLPLAGDTSTDVILVGAGLVGCELANDLALAGYSVRLLEAGSRPLPMASPEQSQALLEAWANLPLSFEGGVTVRSAHQADGINVVATDGRRFVGRVLVSAVGLSTPDRLALQSGLRYDNGIAVDPQTLCTGVAGIHALGDCISIEGKPQRFIEPIFRQARLIADRICTGKEGSYDCALPPIRVKTTSLPLTIAA